jgi:ABC-type phosphate transport system substrate-binding protein
MRNRKLWRNRFLGAATVGVAALTVSLATSGTAFAGVTIPPYPTIGAYPTWYTANNSASNIVRADGSDTTFPMMQVLSDEYNQSGLYGCTLVSSGAQQNNTCDEVTGGAPDYSNSTTTDTTDNFDSTEVLQGLNLVGSGNGQGQLCGTIPTPQTIDFARSSKPIAAIAGCAMVEAGYAKDSVPVVDVQSINPSAFGVATGYEGFESTGPLSTSGGGKIGPVAAGWLPAPYGHTTGFGGSTAGNDPFNCKPQGSGDSGPFCSGKAFSDIDNTPLTAGVPQSSVAYELWCATDSTRITDWGQLTNLTGSEVPGQGTPIGVPIRILGVNKGSGTTATFNSFAYSGASTGAGCSTSSKYNLNAASGPNPLLNDGNSASNHEIALENNASAIGDFAAANWTNDPADQAVDIATSLYFQSYGYYNAIPNSGTITMEPGTATTPVGVPTAWVVSLLNENNTSGGVSIANERANNYPTARTLFNIWNNTAIRASTAGFLNWICDTNPVGSGGGTNTKGTDHLYGPNYDTDITQSIQQFGFTRLNDTTPELNVSKITPADGLVTPNGYCEGNLPIVSTGTNVVTLNTSSGSPYAASGLPASIANGWAVSWPANTGTGTSAGTATVVSTVGSPTNTLTLSASVPATVTQIYFPGHPPVMAVTNPNT